MPVLDLGSVVGPKGEQGATGPQGVQGVQGDPGHAATINGVNALTIKAGDSITLKQEGSALEIGAVVPGKILNRNWDFRKPVNRNGKTEYADNGYAIDSWSIHDGGKLVLNDGYITFYGRSAAVWDNLRQTINPAEYYGKVLTFSILYRSSSTDWIITTKNIGASDASTSLLETQGKYMLATLTFKADSTNNTGFFAVMRGNVGAISSIDLVAAILEEGDHQTHFRQNADGEWEIIDPVDYDLQYLLCSQYSQITEEWVGVQHSNKQLLDNAYWANKDAIINQMGKTEYLIEWSYSIDRWRLPSGSKLSIHSGYVSITNGLDQNFEALSPGQYTASILTTAGLVTSTTTIAEVSAETYVSLNPIGMLIFVPGNGWRLRIQPGAEHRNLIAAKLELGPVQTLAHKEGDTWVLNDPPPNKALELAKCQNYFRIIRGPTYLVGIRGYSVATNIEIPITGSPMRIAPIPTLRNKGNIAASDSDSVVAVTSAQAGGNAFFVLVAENENLKRGSIGIYCNDDIWLDSNL